MKLQARNNKTKQNIGNWSKNWTIWVQPMTRNGWV